jgi:hypothetical protein
MKKHFPLKILIVALTALTAITLNVRAGDEGGRYKLVMARTSNNGADMPYIIDTQTGRLWHETFDAEKNQLVYVSCVYENVDGQLSAVPNETATGLIQKGKGQATPALSHTTIPSGDTLENLDKQANSGDANAQFRLGYDYMYGEGGASINNVVALKWLLIASANGKDQATNLIAILEAPSITPPAQIAEGRKLAREFVPKKE